MKILVVEDEKASRKLAHLVLSFEGHDVADAHCAEDAFSMIAGNPPEVVLLDLSLPGMDGLELVRRLKTRDDTNGIVIVAVTSYPDRFPRESAFDAGCDGYIVKPLDTRTLGEQLKTALLKKNPERN